MSYVALFHEFRCSVSGWSKLLARWFKIVFQVDKLMQENMNTKFNSF